MSSFFVEILCEEIPSKILSIISNNFKSSWRILLQKQNITIKTIKIFTTHRRIVLYINGISKYQTSIIIKNKGPFIKLYKQSFKSFLKSKKLTIDECNTKKNQKDTYISSKSIVIRKKTSGILSQNLFNIIEKINWPISMKWGSLNKTWVRPIQSIITIFNGKILNTKLYKNPYKIYIGSITQGHRIMGNGKFNINSFQEYITKIKKEFVILDSSKRINNIIKQANTIALKNNINWVYDKQLLNEISGLVEWPVLLLGSINKKFMKLPKEVIETCIKKEQRCIPCKNKKGSISSNFLIISNIHTKNKKLIIKGNEQVLQSKLIDAQFCKFQDEKYKLEHYAKKLSELILHEKLGNLYDKSKRLEYIMTNIANKYNIDITKAKQTAKLCKADLMTKMVITFPNLQGIIGRYYAKNYDKTIAKAIEEHYKPKQANDSIPKNKLGILLGIADRIDNLVGFFLIGIKTSGSQDPYYLRRHAISTIRLIESGINITLVELIKLSYNSYTKSIQNKMALNTIINNLIIFFKERIKSYWIKSGLSIEIILPLIKKIKLESIYIIRQKINALTSFTKNKNYKPILIAYKRIKKILLLSKKQYEINNSIINPKLFQIEEEYLLEKLLKKIKKDTYNLIKNQKFYIAIIQLIKLQKPITLFLNNALINTDNKKVTQNRLKLINDICYTIENIIDLSYIKNY